MEGSTPYLVDGYLGEIHGTGGWETAVITPTDPIYEGHSVSQISTNPGKTVAITTQVLDTSGERVDGYIPQIDYVITPSGSMSSGFPANMTKVAIGLYSSNITIPSGSSAVGTYIVSISWTRPGTSQTQYEVHLINAFLPFGNSSVSPA